MIVFSRVTSTDDTFDDRDDLLLVDTTDADHAIAIPRLAGSGHLKSVAPIIKNWRGTNNVIVSAPDGTLIEGRRSVTLAPGIAIWLAPVLDGVSTPEYVTVPLPPL